MTVHRANPFEAWRALSPEAQERVGAAAIAWAIGSIGDEEGAQPNQGFLAATIEAELIVRQSMTDEAADLLFSECGAPFLPDLRPLAISQCRVCGCTDRCACPEGCSWVEDDLCSACAGRNAG